MSPKFAIPLDSCGSLAKKCGIPGAGLPDTGLPAHFVDDVAKINKMALIRRGIKADDIAKLGDGVKSRMATPEKMQGKCVP
ncbi:hypothetical protein CCMA1212_010296 [Trichoderma ghanense]|uniref:Uncharacterized protein n=1 Tax=Trichoderma ghanense TaxID=65468 RepID=A0ABY2GPU4_9HYPO